VGEVACLVQRGDDEAHTGGRSSHSLNQRSGTDVPLGQGAAQVAAVQPAKGLVEHHLLDRKAAVMGDGVADPDSDMCSVVGEAPERARELQPR
jgi:hypothetical protein